MKSKVYYWCPFIDKVATVRSVLNSSYALAKYDNLLDPVILNTCGEWTPYKDEIKRSGVKLEYLTKANILPIKKIKGGFILSRLLYLLIIVKTTYPLFKFLKKNQNNYIIVHLLTSLPLFLNLILRKKSKIVLRISGLPKLTYIRKLLWELSIKKLEIVFCPTETTKIYLENIFPSYKNKFKVLRDPIINIKDIQKLKNQESEKIDKEYFVSIGRFTKQKNYMFLLKFLNNYYKKKDLNFFFYIVGEGEKEYELKEYIKKNNLKKYVKILEYKKNIFPLLKNAKCLISTALWEDPGFTLIESGYLNIPVISSDCPNGPIEFLSNGNGGFLYESNNVESMVKTFEQYIQSNNTDLKKKVIRAKKEVKNYTMFSHYSKLIEILN